MAKCEKGVDGSYDVLIREQFLNTSAVDTALFLWERVPESVEEMVKLAEQYMEAQGGAVPGKVTNRSRKLNIKQIQGW